jgi:hypothetical protein
MTPENQAAARERLEGVLPHGYWPTLVDRADSVRGHYCIGRLKWGNQSYWEFWNKGQWVSAGQVFIGEEAAMKAMHQLRDSLLQQPATSERCGECGHDRRWLRNGVCSYFPVPVTKLNAPCGCKCVYPATGAAGQPPLCPVHKRVDEIGNLEMQIGGNNCIACSLNERKELLDILAPLAPPDGSEDSVTVLHRAVEFYETHAGTNRVVVSYRAPTQCGAFKPSALGVPEPEDRCVLAVGHEGKHSLDSARAVAATSAGEGGGQWQVVNIPAGNPNVVAIRFETPEAAAKFIERWAKSSVTVEDTQEPNRFRDLCRSALAIARREGRETNRASFVRQLEDAFAATPPAPVAEGEDYIHEDELPADMLKEDYDKWYEQSWLSDGNIGVRVGPRPPVPTPPPSPCPKCGHSTWKQNKSLLTWFNCETCLYRENVLTEEVSGTVPVAEASQDELPWESIYERAGTDIMSIAMDGKSGRLTASGLMEAIANYAKAAYEVGRARKPSTTTTSEVASREKAWRIVEDVFNKHQECGVTNAALLALVAAISAHLPDAGEVERTLSASTGYERLSGQEDTSMTKDYDGFRAGMLRAAEMARNEFKRAPEAAKGHDCVYMSGYESACDHLSVIIAQAAVIDSVRIAGAQPDWRYHISLLLPEGIEDSALLKIYQVVEHELRDARANTIRDAVSQVKSLFRHEGDPADHRDYNNGVEDAWSIVESLIDKKEGEDG